MDDGRAAPGDREPGAGAQRALATVVALGGAVVLAGWALEMPWARSLVPGWRTTVPSTALAFAMLAAAIATWDVRRAPLAVAAGVALAAAAATLALATLQEYATGTRSGLEAWGGVWAFDGSPSAGRMSPMAATVVLSLSVAVAAVVVPGRRFYGLARVTAGSALFLAWLAVLALAVDVDRLADVPAFPGLGVPTIAFTALTATAVLGLTTAAGPADGGVGRPQWPVWSMVAVFLAPPVLRELYGLLARTGRVDPQLLTAAVAFAFALIVSLTIRGYAGRLSAAQRAHVTARTELEDRVLERTRALTASNHELLQHQDALRLADRRKDEFLAQLAHELRNPLAPIRTAAHIIGSEKSTAEHQRRAGAIIERQVAVMRRLIDDLLDVNRLTAGRMQLRTTRVALAEVIDLAVATMGPGCEEAGHELIVSLPDAPVYVEADAARLAQALGNLLHNACKFTPPHGHLRLGARRLDPSTAEIVVEDDGMGIDPAFLPHLFEKFTQARPGLGRAQGGLGLGLSLVHGIVTLHGGTVSAASDGADRGSRFVVRLPTSATAPADVVPPAAAATPARRTVVVVDDNEDNANALAALLGLEGHEAHAAYGGAQALALADRVKPDLMLIDIGMPDLDGLEVCRLVRRTPWGRDATLIAQTGFGQPRDLARARDAGFDWHLTKPIDIEQLRRLLSRPDVADAPERADPVGVPLALGASREATRLR
ncbi:MAG: ATP-binding protein [Vicinamibacterales bacterium]